MNIEITDEQIQKVLEQQMKQQVKNRVDTFFREQERGYLKDIITRCVTNEIREKIDGINRNDLIKEVESKALIESIGNKVTETIIDALANHTY